MPEQDPEFIAHLQTHKALETAVIKNSKVLFEKTNGNPSISVQIPLMAKDITRLLKWMATVNKTASNMIISLVVVVFSQTCAMAIVIGLFVIRLINDAYPGQFP